MSLNLCKSASSRDANCPLASLGYLSLVNFTSPGWSHNTLLLDNVLMFGVDLFKIWQSFAALESPPCILAIHIGHVIAATYHSGISSLFARYFPFTHFLSLSLCLAAKGITRVWGFKVRFSFVSSTLAPRTRMGCVLFAPAKQRKTKFQF